MRQIEAMKQALTWIKNQPEPRMIGASKIITDLHRAINYLEHAAQRSHSEEFWDGHDEAVKGVAERWEQALTAPIPGKGVMGEPLESLYRRTEALRQAIGKSEKKEPVADERCAWRQYDDIDMPDTWKSDCGALWTFNEGSPKENGMKFCPSCGKPAIEVANGIKWEA